MKTNDPERIWLAPKCEEEEGRTWEWENIWPEGCKDCGDKAVEYVRADLAAAQVELLRGALERNRQGYANILENRELKADVWGTRNGYGSRFGALTREEIEKELSSIDASLAATPAPALAGLSNYNGSPHG